MTKDNKALFLCSDKQRPLPPKQGHWSKDEHIRFLEGCYLYKNNWPKIQCYIRTRTIPQIRSHAQKFLIKICRKYEIKLSQKKFLKAKSKHLEPSFRKRKKFKKTGIANMNKYERNIFEMFNYYKRDISSINNNNGNNNSNSSSNISPTLINDINFLVYIDYINIYFAAIIVRLYYLILIYQHYFVLNADRYIVYLIYTLNLINIYRRLSMS
jgi:SHAQKYF class myb-like DNA-binding protein